MNFFVTATDTGVGKTYVSAQLALKLSTAGKKVGYFKPFQSGTDCTPDVDVVRQVCPAAVVKNSYVTKTPAAPALSAEIDGVEISLARVIEDYNALCAQCDVVITEGSGGLFVPVAPKILMSDVILALNLPVIIVTRPDLGTINHTLLTISAVKNLGIEISGVIISNYPKNTTDPVITTAKKYIEEFSGQKVFLLDDFIQTLCPLFQA